jgi:hypothetical protein
MGYKAETKYKWKKSIGEGLLRVRNLGNQTPKTFTAFTLLDCLF